MRRRRIGVMRMCRRGEEEKDRDAERMRRRRKVGVRHYGREIVEMTDCK